MPNPLSRWPMPQNTDGSGTKHPLKLFVHIGVWIEPSFPGRGFEHHGLAVVSLLRVGAGRGSATDRC
jgi:hypothetical protein